jgi:DNA helicase-2/ATP-dependent DNA helicase PcrA
MKVILKRLQIDTQPMPQRAFMSAISHAKEELITPSELMKDAMGDYGSAQVAKVYAEYEKELKKSNALDFDDLLLKTVELFTAWPDILESYQERFRYIMVDEYQDTNTVQFEFIRLLASKYRNICVVGDDDQSIYKFRGANIRNILDFEKVYKEARVIKLEQNYRSTQSILDAANAVISNNRGRKDKSLWTDKGDGERIHFRQCNSAYEEAEYVVDSIIKEKREGKYDYSEQAVLYRTNAQARLIEEQLIMSGIPYDVVGGVNFYSRREIKDVLAYLKTIDNGVDDVAVKRIINVPKRGIGQTTVAKVSDFAAEQDISFFEALTYGKDIPGIGKAALKLEAFVNMIAVMRSKAEFMDVSALIKDVLATTGYIEELEESDDDDAEDRIDNIDELISKAVSYKEDNPEGTLSDFLAEVALVADIDSVDENADMSLLMTLHGAKGLEFARVYIAGAEDGVFPGMSAVFDEDPTAIEEERRLAYVGITRAKDDLTITCAKARMIRGETQYNSVSRFVKEIPGELMDDKPAPTRALKIDGQELSRYSDGSSERDAFLSKPYGGYSDVTYSKPRAVVMPKVTPAATKPYIAKSASPRAASGSATAGTKLSYGVGDRVRHTKYGEGTVKDISLEPRDYKVTVEFDGAGQKIMYATFAKLEKI